MNKWLKFVLALVLVALIMLSTGWAQHWFVRIGSQYILDAPVYVAGVRGLNSITIDELRVYASEEHRLSNRPTLIMRGARFDVSWWPWATRHVNNVEIQDFEFRLDSSGNAGSNYAFLIPKPDSPPFDISLLPERVHISEFHVAGLLPYAGYAFRGIELTLVVAASKSLHLAAKSSTFSGEWTDHGGNFEEVWSEGFADLVLTREGDVIDGQFLAGIPGLVEGQGSMSAVMEEGMKDLEIRFQTLHIFGEAGARISKSFAPVPISFDLLDCSGLELSFASADATTLFPDGQVQARLEGLTVGNPEHVLFDGDLSIQGHVDGAGGRSELAVLVNGSAPARIILEGNRDAGQARLEFDDWRPEGVKEILPSDIMPYADLLTYASLSGEFVIDWTESAYNARGTLRAQPGLSGREPPISLTAIVEGSGTEQERTISARFDSQFGSGAAEGWLRAGPEDELEGEVTMDNMRIDPWIRILTLGAVGVPEDMRATGTITLAGEDDHLLKVVPILRIDPIRAGDLDLLSTTLEGTLTVSKADNTYRIEALTWMGEEGSTLVLSEWTLDRSLSTGEGRIDVEARLDTVGRAFGIDDAWGTFTVSAPFTLADGALKVSGRINSGDASLGDWALPYGRELEGTFELLFDRESERGELRGVVVNLGEGTKLSAPLTTLTLSPFVADGSLTFSTDFRPFVEMELAGDAVGNGEVQGSFRIEGDLISVDGRLNATLERLSLSNGIAQARALSINTEFTNAGILSGTGSIEMEELVIAGAHLREFSGSVLLEDKTIKVEGIKGRLFKGTLEGELSVDTANELRAALEVWAVGLDLDQFTKEVQPKSTELTGIADVAGRLVYSLRGLEELSLDAQSVGGITLNRSVVEELLSSGQLEGALAQRIAGRAMDKILGTAPQRPFESARLNLGLEGERVVGTARLESDPTEDTRGLDLDVELAIDVSALAQALKSLQEGAIGEVEVRAAPQ